MKDFALNVVTFALGAVVGVIGGAFIMAAGQLTSPELREMTEKLSSDLPQI